MAGAPAVFLNPQAHSLRATCSPSAQCSLRHTWPLAVLEHEETVGELCLKHNSKETIESVGTDKTWEKTIDYAIELMSRDVAPSAHLQKKIEETTFLIC